MKPIDFHVHFYPEKIAPRVVDGLRAHYGIAVNHRATRDEYLRLARAAGVARAVFCAPGMGAVYRVQVPNDEGSGSRSLRQRCPS